MFDDWGYAGVGDRYLDLVKAACAALTLRATWLLSLALLGKARASPSGASGSQTGETLSDMG